MQGHDDDQVDDDHGHHDGNADHRGHERAHPHEHPEESGLKGMLRTLVGAHHHDPADSFDQALEDDRDGVRALVVSLGILTTTAVLQGLVVALSGSIALFGDALHNIADALTAVPLWLAFHLGRRAVTRRFTYGFGKSEDLAGLFVVTLIAASAVLAGWQAITRLLHPHTIHNLPLVMVAGVIGLVGNECVAQIRIRTGRRIGSAALEADGLHARADGITSLLVVVGAIGVAVHWNWADPVVGLLIAATIAVVLVKSIRSVGGRLMDAVDPKLVEEVGHLLGHVDGIVTVSEVRLRWVGHRLYAAVRVGVSEDLSVGAGHEISERACHALLHGLPQLADAIVHVDPVAEGRDPHETTAHHRHVDQ